MDIKKAAVQDLAERLNNAGVFELIEMHTDNGVIRARDLSVWADFTTDDSDMWSEFSMSHGFTFSDMHAIQLLAPEILVEAGYKHI